MIAKVLLLSTYSVTWHVLSFVVFVVSVLMVGVILIQDSKDTGLTNAFGGGGSSNALLGARMQKDLAKFPAILGILLSVCLMIMGLLDANRGRKSLGTVNAGPVNSGAPATPGSSPLGGPGSSQASSSQAGSSQGGGGGSGGLGPAGQA